MTKLSIGTLAAVGLTAALAPVLLAAPASAQVTGAKVEGAETGKDCVVGATACRIVVTVSGSDATSPVTITANGAVVANAVTPTGGSVNVPWTPPANGKYEIVITQGSANSTLSVGVPGRAESNTALPGGITDIIKALTGSAGAK